jgi:hypothetical protein
LLLYFFGLKTTFKCWNYVPFEAKDLSRLVCRREELLFWTKTNVICQNIWKIYLLKTFLLFRHKIRSGGKLPKNVTLWVNFLEAFPRRRPTHTVINCKPASNLLKLLCKILPEAGLCLTTWRGSRCRMRGGLHAIQRAGSGSKTEAYNIIKWKLKVAYNGLTWFIIRNVKEEYSAENHKMNNKSHVKPRKLNPGESSSRK